MSLPTPAQGRRLRDEDSLANSSPGSRCRLCLGLRSPFPPGLTILEGVSRPGYCNKALKQLLGGCHPLVVLPHSMVAWLRVLSRAVISPESRCHLSCALVSESPRSLKASFACFFLGRWHPGKWCPVWVFITSPQAPFLTLSPGDGVAPHCSLSLTASQKPELDQHRVSSDSDASASWNYQQSTYQIPQSSSTGKRKGGFRKISPLVTNLTFSKGRKFYLCLRTTSQYSLPR